MQRPHMEGCAEQRQTVAYKAPAQLVKHLDVVVDARAFAEDPVPDPAARYRRAQTGIGALRSEELFAAYGRVGRDIEKHARIHSRSIGERRAESVRHAR